MPRKPEALLAERRSARAHRANGRTPEQLRANRLRLKELDRMPWVYGPQHAVPCPSFAPGVAAQLAAALSGKGGDPV